MATDQTGAGPGEEYYQQNYRSYDRQNPERKLAFYRRQIDAHRDRALPQRLYDIGCGPGNFLKSLGGSWDVYGSDINHFAVATSRQAMPRGRFAIGAGARDPLFEERFPVITAFDVLEHVPEIDQSGSNIAAQLLPGGIFVFVVPVYDGLSGPIITRLDKDPTHVHKRARAFWLDWARGHFDVVAWHGIVRYLLPGGYYAHWPTAALRHHTPAILVVCRSRARA